MERGSRRSPAFASSSERKKGQGKHYAVFEGRERGVFDNWGECDCQVNGFSRNVHCSYKSRDEAVSALKKYERGEAGSSTSKGEGKHYAVFEGRERGVFDNWGGCASQVNGFPRNLHCSYKSRDEAVSALENYVYGEGEEEE